MYLLGVLSGGLLWSYHCCTEQFLCILSKLQHFSHATAGSSLCGVLLMRGYIGHAQIAPMEGGRINIQYRRVECTPPEPLKVNIHANVGVGGWLRIAVEVRSTAI